MVHVGAIMGIAFPPSLPSSSSSLLKNLRIYSIVMSPAIGYKTHSNAVRDDISLTVDSSDIKTCRRTYVQLINLMLLLQQDQALLVFRSSFQRLLFDFLIFSLKNTRNNLTSCDVCSNCCYETEHCCPSIKSFCFWCHDSVPFL